MKIFLDTNIWLRLFLQDNQDQFEKVSTIFSVIEQGKFKAYTSTIVLMEIHFILKKVYSQSDTEIINIFEKIREIRGMTIIEKTNLKMAIKFYKQYGVKFSDCLIASQLPENSTLITFDREFSEIKEIRTNEPQELL